MSDDEARTGTETTTQFVARVLGLAPPPGHGTTCWLCGGPCGAEAKPQREVIAPTFTQHNLAGCADSTVSASPSPSTLIGNSQNEIHNSTPLVFVAALD